MTTSTNLQQHWELGKDRTDFEKCFPNGGPAHGFEAAIPVGGGFTETSGAALGIIVEEDVAIDGTFQRMADVIDDKAVAIAPARHMEVVRRCPIVVPEGLVEEEIAGSAIVSKTESVTDNEETERLPERRFQVELFGRLIRLDGRRRVWGKVDFFVPHVEL